MKYIIIFFLFPAVYAGCSSSVKTDKEQNLVLNELKSAPSEIKIDGISYTLETYIWRNLMPDIDTTTGRGLISSIKIKTAGGSEIPKALAVKRFWIINGNSIWVSKSFQVNLLAPDVMEVYASDGPKWDKGTKIDVVVEINHNNNIKLLGIKNQEVHAVY